MTAVDDPDTREHPTLLEPPVRPRTGFADFRRDFGADYAVNGLIGLVFCSTGPVAVILAAGAAGGLTAAQLSSWIFGIFALNGILTVAMSLAYRQPLGFAWTIPGTVLVGAALTHLSWAEVIGAYLVTGALVTVLGASGLVRRAMSALPMPIVMAMVAGVFLSFGTDLIGAVGSDAAIAAPMVIAFIALSALGRVGRYLPPILGALLAGVGAVAATGRFDSGAAHAASGVLASPVFTAPAFTASALAELVIPLAVTVLVVQNGQGFAVLTAAGHRPPINVTTIVCGVWSMAAASVGAISSCLTGPTNALLTVSGTRGRQYTAAVWFGGLCIVFALFAPVFVAWMSAAPKSFVAALGGLAMLKALQGAFVSAFSTRYTLGALVAFVVTAANHSFAHIGAAFWGLVAGVVVSALCERADWAHDRAHPS